MNNSSNDRPTFVRYRVMAFLLALSFLTYFDRQCIVWVKPQIQSELKLSDEQMGLVLGAFWLAYCLFDIPAGWLGDRYGARIALTRVVLAWSLFTMLTGCTFGFLSILAARFLFGAFEAGAYPNMARVQSAWLPLSARGRAGGWLWLAARWGAAFSPFLFIKLIELVDRPAIRKSVFFVPDPADIAGWRLGFAVAGLVGVIWCLAFYPWFRNDPAEKPSVNAAELALIRAGQTREEGHGRIEPGMWRALLASRSLWALSGLYFFGSFGWSFFVSWMPDYLLRVHHVAYDASQNIWKQPLLYGGVSCVVGGLLSDWLVRRTGRKRLGRAIFPVSGLIVAATSLLFARESDDPNTVIALICVAGAAFDFGQGANWASIVDIGGRYAGTAAGFVNLVGNMGNAIQPAIGAWIFNSFGWGPLFGVYASVFLIAAAMWLFIDPTRRFHDAE